MVFFKDSKEFCSLFEIDSLNEVEYADTFSSLTSLERLITSVS